MNVPLERMEPQAAAECIKSFRPKVVYPVSLRSGPGLANRTRREASGGSTVRGFDALRKALTGGAVGVRTGAWY